MRNANRLPLPLLIALFSFDAMFHSPSMRAREKMKRKYAMLFFSLFFVAIRRRDFFGFDAQRWRDAAMSTCHAAGAARGGAMRDAWRDAQTQTRSNARLCALSDTRRTTNENAQRSNDMLLLHHILLRRVEKTANATYV